MRPALLIVLGLFVLLHGIAHAQGSRSPASKTLYESELSHARLLKAAQETSQASPDIDVTYYGLKIALATPPRPPLLSGDVVIDALSRSDSLSEVTLDLRNTMSVDSVFAGSRPALFTQQTAALHITLDQIYARNTPVHLRVVYHGLPTPTGFGSFVFSNHNGTPWVWSLSEPYGARDWWPNKDHPSDKADSSDVWIICDAALRAASNGRLLGVVDNGDGTRTWKWSERYPIASYLISVAVTNYDTLTEWFRYTPTDSMPVLHYILPEQAGLITPALHHVIAALSIFSDLYGLYPFIKEKYGHAWIGQGGAMEHQTMTSTTTADEGTIVHELAHQWFGDMITCRTWGDLWLNEGFATYSQALYNERRYGTDSYRQTIAAFLRGAQTTSAPLRVRDTSSVGLLFDQADVYYRGASVLHMLRHVLGDSLFFRSLHAYASSPRLRYGSATSEGFRSVCEQTSVLPLGYFFDEWLDGTGYPSYSYSWNAAPGTNGWHTRMHLVQRNGRGEPTLFSMPLDVKIEGNGFDTTVTIFNSAATEDVVFVTEGRPVNVRLDPDSWVLADVLNLNVQTLPSAFRIGSNYPNPFNPSTTIPFELPGRSHVTVTVTDAAGKEVATLFDGLHEAGSVEVEWKGTAGNGRKVASGVYFYSVTTAWGTKTGKMILAK